MPVTGQGRRKILVVAEAPGREEDYKNIQLIGQSGQLFRQSLHRHGIDLERDCWKTNAIRCMPPKKRTPSDREIGLCRQYLLEDVRRLRPEKILVLGASALKAITFKRVKDLPITKSVGTAIPDHEFEAWVFPIYHPAYILRQQRDMPLRLLFEEALAKAISHNKPFPYQYDPDQLKKKVEIITDPGAAAGVLHTLPARIAFDYETTGIKPHGRGHEIVCAAVATGDQAYAFPFFDNKDFRAAWERLMTDNTFPEKIAHNLQFEDIWTRDCLGYQVRAWHWDTMLAQKVLDNRSKASLKFQAYARYGVAGYDASVEPFLKSGEGGGNGFNRVRECDQNGLMLYCGLDALLTYMLYEDQVREFEALEFDLSRGREFLFRGSLELSRVHSNGIYTSSAYYRRQIEDIRQRKAQAMARIRESREWQLFRNTQKKDLNINSTPQLQYTLYTLAGHKVEKKTTIGNPSTDKETLLGIDTPFTRAVIEYKRLHKTASTYLQNFLDEAVDNVMHPFFTLHGVTTYRSSSSKPNFQNIPRRDPEIQRLCRGGILPSPGNLLLECDYSSIEVRISACYHHDPVMIKYINDPTTDMHRDQAQALFLLDREQVTKEVRSVAKNGFVFPQFYGSYWEQCAPNLWTQVRDLEVRQGMSVYEHLQDKGLKDFSDFEAHVRDEEEIFWKEKFRVYDQWKERMWRLYQNRGYIKTLTGFKLGGYMKRNDTINYPIQGTAFHCLLWSLMELGKQLRDRALRTRIVGQIHDSIVLDVWPAELDQVKVLVREIMCERIRRSWPWLIIPLEIEAEATEIDRAWCFKQEISI